MKTRLGFETGPLMTTKREISKSGLEQSALHLLHRAGQCAGDVFHTEMSLEGLTPRQYAVLLAIAEQEGLSQTDLVTKTGVDRSTLADIARRLIKKGLVQRRRTKQDARAYSVRLTEAGWNILKSAEPAAVHTDKRILSALSPAKRDEFLKSLNTIVSSLDMVPVNGNGKYR